MKYEAIIWDCDGVLIDSEKIANQAVRDLFKDKLNIEISIETVLAEFMGKNLNQIFEYLNNEYGTQISNPFSRKDILKKQYKEFKKHLKPTKGIKEVLNSINIPMAVASGSAYERLMLTLDITNLTEYFAQHIYSTEVVDNGKPSPDVFLYAAEKLDVCPSKCIVVEDSSHGIEAAQAANMDVVAYLGGEHITPTLKERALSTGVNKVIYNILDLLDIIK